MKNYDLNLPHIASVRFDVHDIGSRTIDEIQEVLQGLRKNSLAVSIIEALNKESRSPINLQEGWQPELEAMYPNLFENALVEAMNLQMLSIARGDTVVATENRDAGASPTEEIDETYVWKLLNTDFESTGDAEKDYWERLLSVRRVFADVPDSIGLNVYKGFSMDNQFYHLTGTSVDMFVGVFFHRNILSSDMFSHFTNAVLGLYEAQMCLISEDTSARQKLAAYVFIFNVKDKVAQYVSEIKDFVSIVRKFHGIIDPFLLKSYEYINTPSVWEVDTIKEELETRAFGVPSASESMGAQLRGMAYAKQRLRADNYGRTITI